VKTPAVKDTKPKTGCLARTLIPYFSDVSHNMYLTTDESGKPGKTDLLIMF
jgi:hypothetical protein